MNIYILRTKEKRDKMNNVLNYFPEKLKKILEEVIIKENLVLEEIRVRVGKPIILKFNGKAILLYIIKNTRITCY